MKLLSKTDVRRHPLREAIVVVKLNDSNHV
jgi:hypothetical protein